jgi:hypothetical protein
MLMQSFAYSHPAMSSKEMSGLLVRMHFRSAFFSSMLYLVLSSECMFSPIWQLDCESQTIWVELRTFLEISRVALHSSGVIDCDSIPESYDFSDVRPVRLLWLEESFSTGKCPIEFVFCATTYCNYKKVGVLTGDYNIRMLEFIGFIDV